MLGATLCPTLEAQGFQVIRHGRLRGDIRCDLTSAEATHAMIAASKPDYIVHLAALTNVDECEAHPNRAYLDNTRMVECLVGAMRALDADTHLVHISTDQVYDGMGPHREDAVTLMNYYAFSKYAGELAALSVPSTVLRTNFFGPSRSPSRSSFSDWIVAALKRGDAVRVFEDVAFSPLAMESLCRLISSAMRQRLRGLYNAGSREGMSKAEFCFALAGVLHLPTASMCRTTSTSATLRAYRPKDMRMDCGRLESALGVRLPTLQQEIESVKVHYENA
jgi:dTDP-4-dehydrorhamnose reductase